MTTHTPASNVTTAPVPPTRLSLTRKTGLAAAGLRDRIRYGRLDPNQPTDFTLRLEHQAQLAEIEVRLWGATQQQQIDAARARAQCILDQSVENLPEVAPRCPEAPTAEKLAWAQSYRAREASQTRRRTQETALTQAQNELTTLPARQNEVTARVQHLVAAWITHYQREASHYQRARTGLLGLVRRTPCQSPTYHHPDINHPSGG